ncbi:MAG: transglutaminase-like domain-containing protein, partial [Xenococcaceae cyanobacterium]
MSAFLFGAALMFWGWQTGLWVLALPMEAIFVASYFIHWRWNLSVGDYKKIGKFCLFLAIAVLVYLFTRNPSIYLIFAFFQWLPLIFFPLLAAGIYSINDRLDLRNQKEQKAIANYLIYPYFAICIISASAANVRGYSFYIGMFVLVTLALWFVRSARFLPIIWLCLILIAASMGVVGNMGLYRLQGFLEQNTLEWFSDFARQDIDPLKRTTAIGEIGSVKLSNQIVFRIKPEQGQLAPTLLRTATYNKYQSSMWVAANSQFTPVKSEANKMSWHLGERKAHSSTIIISAHLERGEDLLKLPDGSFAVNNLSVARMEKNQYGTVKVEGKSDPVSYRIEFGKYFTLDSSPSQDDLLVPDREKPALDRIISQLNLEGKSDREILKEVESFFQREFEYSLELAQQKNNSTPLSAFLLENRSGHCEYFATATTLLLRRLGIPTRYAIGYSVHEFSQLENQFIVRGRHAHAWTLVY